MNLTFNEVPNHKGIVVISHGMGEHQGLYRDVCLKLNEKGYSTAIYDLFGHGSNHPNQPLKSYRIYVDELDQAVNEVRKHHKKVFLIGFSLGAMITNLYLVDHNNVSGAIVLSGKTKPINSIILPGLLFRNKKLKLNYSDPKKRHEVDLSLNCDPVVLKEVNYQMLYQTLYQGLKKLSRSIKTITTPLLIQHGGSDEIVDSVESIQFYERLKSKKQIIIYPNSKHDLLFDVDKELVINDLVSFMDYTE